MSDDEVEAFDITEEDLDRAFNPGLRSSKGLSKNQQIYGMWADDSGDEGPSQRSGFGSKSRKPKNYSAPVSFVAGGVHQAGKNKKKEIEKEEEDDDDDKRQRTINSSDSSEEDEPRASFKNLSMSQIDGEIAGLRKKRSQFSPALANKGVGKWEQHTKGIGAKLLLQMGYQPGKGLGKDLQGIQAPIEASLRKGRGAIGAYGPEKGQKIADLDTDKKKTEKEKDISKTDKVSQWRKEDGSSKNQKVRYVYKSIEDVLEESKQPGKKKSKREFNELSKVKVIDMTGPEQRVLSGYHAISSVQKPSEQWEIRKEKKFNNFELPELQHNLNLLVDMCEEAIVSSDRKLQYAENRIVALEAEVEALAKVEKQEAETISVLDKVMEVVQRLVSGSQDNSLTLQEAFESFQELRDKYYMEYCIYEIWSLADTIVRPLFKDSLSAWSPLQDPSQPVSAFQQWRTILEQDQTLTLSTVAQDPYHKLLWDTWMPCVRIAASAWQCRKFETMIVFLETWSTLIPAWILDNILQQLILPRLHHETEEWNPLTDTIPIHTWIHPWLPYLGKYLATTIFPVIRHKLSSALVSWHPSDCSARLMLQPWVGVFSKGEMDAFLINHIVPKLHLTLQEFAINPHQQHLDNWNWVMEWLELLPSHIMASLLDKSFFPKWLQVLTLWLNLNPNYDQVTNWYTGWKRMVPDNLLSEPLVKEHFRSALDLMNRSVGGTPLPQPAQAESAHSQAQARYQGLAESIRTAQQIPQGFKDLVAKRCEERGIVFMPLPNRFREAKQVYKCGKLQIYIDRNVLFVLNAGQWEPTSLNALLDMVV